MKHQFDTNNDREREQMMEDLNTIFWLVPTLIMAIIGFIGYCIYLILTN